MTILLLFYFELIYLQYSLIDTLFNLQANMPLSKDFNVMMFFGLLNIFIDLRIQTSSKSFNKKAIFFVCFI